MKAFLKKTILFFAAAACFLFVACVAIPICGAITAAVVHCVRNDNWAELVIAALIIIAFCELVREKLVDIFWDDDEQY